MKNKIATAAQVVGRLVVTSYILSYIVSDTFTSVVAFKARAGGVKLLSPGLLDLASNACLAAISIPFLLQHTRRQHDGVSFGRLLSLCLQSVTSVHPKRQWKAYGSLVVPALLHLGSSILFRAGLQFTTYSVLSVIILFKIPITAFLHHFIFFRQRDRRVWLSLSLLIAGLLLLYLPLGLRTWVTQLRGEAHHEFREIRGCALGLAAALLLSITSLYTEALFKHPVPFWVTQFWLGVFGFVVSGIASSLSQDVLENRYVDDMAFSIDPLASEPTSTTHTVVNLLLIAAITTTSIRASAIFRQDDSLGMIAADAVSIVTIMVAKCLLSAAFRGQALTEFTCIGGGIIIISAWTYLYCKRPRSSGYLLLGSDSLESPELDRSKAVLDHKGDTRVPIVPTRRRVVLAALFVALLEFAQLLAPVFPGDGSDPAPGQPHTGSQKGGASGESQLPPHSNTTSRIQPVDDIGRFFKPHNIAAATWGQTDSSPNCIVDWIDREHVYPISTKFTDWEYSFATSGCPVYPIPEGGMIFHQYWSGEWRPFNELSIAAWLATQRLGDGHRMIYWFNDGGPPDSVRRRFQPFSDFIEFKELDATKEAEGTCVADMPEWNSLDYQQANDMKLVALSDIIRNLLLSKYGGVWLDADTIPLRDLTPMIRSGPSACSINDQDWNNNVLVFGPPNTNVTNRILETTCSLSTNETAYREKFGLKAITPIYWHWMWNDGLFKHCEQNQCGVSRIPVYFTDGWGWFGKGQRALKPCDPGERWWHDSQAPLPRSLRTLFTWHARLGQYDAACLGPGTLVAAVARRIDELLGYGLEMRGRDLFAGPALTTREIDGR